MNKRIYILIFSLIITKISYSQWWIPNEYFGKGQYWETDAYNFQSYPYTIFSHANGLSISEQKNNLIGLIIAGKPDTAFGPSKNEFYTIYNELWNFAWSQRPEYTQNGEDNEESADPNTVQAWAKAHAFICFLGIKPDGTPLSSADFETLAWTAEDALVNMNTDVEWWEYKKLLGRSRELIAAVQAYDLLKAAYEIRTELDLIVPNRYPWGFGDYDRNSFTCSERNKLRRAARELYTYSEGWLSITDHKYGWKKNHGIAAASAILMAAQVLNDAGTETNILKGNFLFKLFGGVGHNPTYSPINWMERSLVTTGGIILT